MDNEKGWIAVFWSMIGLGILAVIFNTGKVESDLTGRVNAALHNNGYEWASVKHSSGRNLVLVGRSPVMSARQPALDEARDVYGVRCIDDETSVSDPASPYAWSATITTTQIILAGSVPDKASRTLINSKAAEIAVGRKVQDNMTLADGAPDTGWMDNIDYALARSRNIKNGAVLLVDRSMTIEGTAWNNADAKSLTTASKPVAGYKLSTNVTSPAMLTAETPAPAEDAAADKPAVTDKPAIESKSASAEKAPKANASTSMPDAATAKTDIAPPPASQPAADTAMKDAAATDQPAAKPGIFSKTLSAIKSIGSRGKADKADEAGDKVDEASNDAGDADAGNVNAASKADAAGRAEAASKAEAEANSDAKSDAGSAPGRAAQSDDTGNGTLKAEVKHPGAINGGSAAALSAAPSAASATSDSATASAAPPAGTPAQSGSTSGDLASAKPASADQAAAPSAAKTAAPAAAKTAANTAAVTAKPGKAEDGQGAPPAQRAVAGPNRQAGQLPPPSWPGAYAVPRVLAGPQWTGPYWAGPGYYGPSYGPGYYPLPPCPWGPGYCAPRW